MEECNSRVQTAPDPPSCALSARSPDTLRARTMSGRRGRPDDDDQGSVKWPRFFEQNFRVVKWIVGRGLCCRAERQRVRVGLIRGAAVKGCVRSPCVVEGDVAAD